MQNVKTLTTFPNGTPIDAVQGRITKVYKREIKETTYGTKSKQDGIFEDASGSIKITAWEHPELDVLVGKEVVIHASGNGKGLKVNHNEWKGKLTISLEVGKMGQFQTVAVYSETKGPSQPDAAKPTPVLPPTASGPQNETEQARRSIHGATAGLATNKAIDILIATGNFRQETLEQDIMTVGGAIARAALRLEAGEIEVGAKPKEDVPF